VRPEFGYSVTPGPADGVAEESTAAEAMGYDRIGIWDSPALFREPWVTLAATAMATRSAAIGPWVTNPLSRHPVVTAAAAASVDDLAPGRVYIGIGSGGTGAWHLGYRTATLAQLQAYVHALRGLLEEGRAEWEGRECRLEWAKRRIPIILSAHGPQSLRLAGRIADGVVAGLGVTPEVVRACLDLVAEGAREAGRSPEDVAVWFTCFWLPGVSAEDATWAATAFALHFARSGVEGKFVPDEHREAVVELGRAYDLISHGAVSDEEKRHYADLAERLGIAEYLRRRFVFSGTPEEVEAQIREAMEAGASRFDGAIDADLPEHHERIERWAKLVLPRFAA
jgi:5,10-methylenetetrahydromethanopterin reductase